MYNKTSNPINSPPSLTFGGFRWVSVGFGGFRWVSVGFGGFY